MALEFRSDDPAAWNAVLALGEDVRRAGGRVHVVGGGVRDALLGRPVVDFDLEVFGLQGADLRRVVEQRFVVDEVGESFGVLKVRGLEVDLALPRRERKAGQGHRGFDVAADPFMSIEEAARRRDFTINTIAYDPLEQVLHDPLGGEADLRAGLLRHSSPRFVEDPLRVLRGAQFVARFDLVAAPETVELCRTMDLEGLAAERLFEEWRKLLVLGRVPGRGLAFLHEVGWLRYFPEVERLDGCPQDPEWHPEGDVLVHTGHVLDAFAAARTGDPAEDLIVGLGCLCHDFGKPETTVLEEGRWRSIGHEVAGEAPTRSFLERLTSQRSLIEEVVPLVLHHMKPFQLFQARAGDAAVRRLSVKVRLDRLAAVSRADAAGRPPLPASSEAEDWLLERAEALAVRDAAPVPLVLGRHLIDLGATPGPAFGPLLDRCYEAQLEGHFHDLEGGLELLRRLVEEGAGA